MESSNDKLREAEIEWCLPRFGRWRKKRGMGVKLPVERLTNSEDLMYSPVIRVSDTVS